MLRLDDRPASHRTWVLARLQVRQETVWAADSAEEPEELLVLGVRLELLLWQAYYVCGVSGFRRLKFLDDGLYAGQANLMRFNLSLFVFCDEPDYQRERIVSEHP